MRTLLFLLAASAVAAPMTPTASATIVQGEPVLLRIAPPEGQVSRHHMTTDVVVQSPMMPTADGAMTVRQEVFVTSTVTRAEPTRHEIEQVIDSASFELPGGAAGMPEIAGMRQRMTMDARGRVVSIQPDQATTPPEMRSMMEQVAEKLSGVSIVLPEDAIRPGGTWDTSQELTMPTGAGLDIRMVMKSRYRLERVERRGGARHAIISLDGTLTQESAATDPAGPAAAMQMKFEGEIAGEMDLDLDAGRLVNVHNRMTMVGELEMNAQTVPMSSTATTRIELLAR